LKNCGDMSNIQLFKTWIDIF